MYSSSWPFKSPRARHQAAKTFLCVFFSKHFVVVVVVVVVVSRRDLTQTWMEVNLRP